MTATRIQHPSSRDKERQPDPYVRHKFEIRAPRETVFDALTTSEGLSGWWTTGANADTARVGSDVQFTFRGPFNPHLRVTELDPPAHIVWEGIDGHAAWGAHTSIQFDLDTTRVGTVVDFRHWLGPNLSDDTVAEINFNWGYYLDSLRLLCEMGAGKPYQPGIATSRVAAGGTA